VNGITGTQITAGNRSDTITGESYSEGVAGSILGNNNGIEGSDLSTGGGDDSIAGRSFITGEGLLVAYGSGIARTTIDAGGGHDVVEGIGAEQAVGGVSFGLLDVNLTLGTGDDFVFARGASGGVSGVMINGGDGLDVFDVQGGTGTIDGGAQDDELILAGSMEDYDFLLTGIGQGTITGDGTDLDILDIEFITFEEGPTYSFDQLF